MRISLDSTARRLNVLAISKMSLLKYSTLYEIVQIIGSQAIIHFIEVVSVGRYRLCFSMPLLVSILYPLNDSSNRKEER